MADCDERDVRLDRGRTESRISNSDGSICVMDEQKTLAYEVCSWHMTMRTTARRKSRPAHILSLRRGQIIMESEETEAGPKYLVADPSCSFSIFLFS